MTMTPITPASQTGTAPRWSSSTLKGDGNMSFTLRVLEDQRGAVPVWLAGVIVVIVIYVLGSLGSLAASGASGAGGTVPGSPSTCFTKCGFFMEFRCEDNSYIGFCF